MVPYLELFKAITEKSYRRSKYNYLRSMVVEGNLQFVLLGLEKRRDITI